uniref:2-carboxy-D-arabinitol-1-phosphatase n=1 Tax=Araucaria cunninghamii TaxID=56994 RepID=A0A0D6R669_ARACU
MCIRTLHTYPHMMHSSSGALFEGCAWVGQFNSSPRLFLNRQQRVQRNSTRLCRNGEPPHSYYVGVTCKTRHVHVHVDGRKNPNRNLSGFLAVGAVVGSDRVLGEGEVEAFPSICSGKRVVLVRHGQSTWNEEGRIQGSSDFAVLTDKGEIQAETSRQMLLGDTFDVCFHSPLARSRRTAEIICDSRKIEMIPEFDLREIDLYSFQGLLKHEGKERFGKAFRQWQKDAVNFIIDGHYPVRELWARAKACWRKILSHKGQSILVVAHNAVNQALVATAIGLGPEYFRVLLQSNCGITVLDFIPSIANGPPYICLNRLNQTPNSPVTTGQTGGRKARDRIIVVCHGTTGSVSEGQLPTSFDESINMLGRIQSQKTAELLLDLRVSSIVCSPQLAALETAEAIAQVQEAADCLGADCVPRYVEMKHMQELGDMYWGALVQLQKQVVQHGKWQDYLQQDCNSLGETLSTFWDITGEAWNGLTEHLRNLQKNGSNPERNIVVVGNEISNIGLLCHCLGLQKSSIGSFHLDTGSISVIDFPDGSEGRGVIRCLNYTAHLGRWSVPVSRPAMGDEDF